MCSKDSNCQSNNNKKNSLKIKPETQYRFNTIVLCNGKTYSGVLNFILHDNKDASYTHSSSYELNEPTLITSVLGVGFYNSDGYTSHNNKFNVSFKNGDSFINQWTDDGNFQSYSGIPDNDCECGTSPFFNICNLC